MTKKQVRLSKKYLIYKLLTNLWFLTAIWLYFYRIYITDKEIGILDGIAFAIGLLAEVPSGALADKFGRDKIVKLGQFLAGSGFMIQAFGSRFFHFLLGQTIMVIGTAFVSGADEALFFQQLKFKKESAEWKRLVIRGTQVALVGVTSAVILGGWLYGINERLPWILTSLPFFASVILLWNIKDTRLLKSGQSLLFEVKKQWKEIKLGFKEFLTPKLFFYVPIIMIIQGLFYAVEWGLLRVVLLDRFHFSPLMGSIVVSSCSLLTVGILFVLHRYAGKVSEKRIITTISVLSGMSLLVSIFDIGVWGYFVILIFCLGENILYPFMSEVLNYRTSENNRATVLSVSSFLRTLPYVLLAPIIGSLNAMGKLEYFLVGWAIMIVVAVSVYLLHKKKDIQITLTESD